jgi:hypothetical protein
MGLAFLFVCQRVCVVIYGFFAVCCLLFMLYVGPCVVYFVTFLIVINTAIRAMLPLWRWFLFLYLPVVAHIVIRES